MSLDISLTQSVYSANITHNLGEMAREADIYEVLWLAEEMGYCARDLISPLSKGLALLLSDPERFKKFNSPNGWGMYEHFVPFIANYLEACIANPDAQISVSR
jgi:hypothetical protein